MNYTVTQVNNYIKNMFDSDCVLNNIYVKGEVSNCKYHSSGHIYFTLKDDYGQIAGVMFAGQRKGLKFHLEEGQSVIILGNIGIYERDGRYQIYAREITLDGLGALYMRYEELKKILSLKGIFDDSHKKNIPEYCRSVGIVTARTGAALQDIVNISRRRNPYIKLVLCSAIVQGEEAVNSIVNAIEKLDKLELDVIIVGRGGGSIEDLWAFNDEKVAMAVYNCETPIISAVGHETDTTIIDYVSDLRAPTPSAAAELAVFDYTAFKNRLSDVNHLLNNRIIVKINTLRAVLDSLKLRIQHAGPEYRMQQYRQYLSDINDRIYADVKVVIKNKRHQLDIYIERLGGLSPLNRLKSGYAFVTDSNKRVIKTIDDIEEGKNIQVSLIDGEVIAKVEEKTNLKRGQN